MTDWTEQLLANLDAVDNPYAVLMRASIRAAEDPDAEAQRWTDRLTVLFEQMTPLLEQYAGVIQTIVVPEEPPAS